VAQIFISYSRKHPVYADFLIEDLERDGYTYWMDRSNMPPGKRWQQSIFHAIDDAMVVLIIVTKEALRSKWIRLEIEYAVSRSKTCIPLFMQTLDIDMTLKMWGLDAFHAIDFVADRRKAAYAKLLEALQELTDTWKPLEKLINTKLNHWNPRIRLMAARTLGETKNARVLDALFEALSVEERRDFQAEIIEQLANFNNDRVVSFALQLVTNPTSYGLIELAAISVLNAVGIGNSKVANVLISELSKEASDWSDASYKIRIAHILYQFPDLSLKEIAVSALLHMANDEGFHSYSRTLAALELSEIGEPRAIPPIRAILESDKILMKESLRQQLEQNLKRLEETAPNKKL
jgi:HEAT repeat protein